MAGAGGRSGLRSASRVSSTSNTGNGVLGGRSGKPPNSGALPLSRTPAGSDPLVSAGKASGALETAAKSSVALESEAKLAVLGGVAGKPPLAGELALSPLLITADRSPPSLDEVLAALAAAGLRPLIQHDGIRVLGVPVGTDAFERAFASEGVDSVASGVLSKLPLFRDRQSALLLLRLVATSKLSFLLRGLPPENMAAAAAAHDANVRSCFSALFQYTAQNPLPDRAWEQATSAAAFAVGISPELVYREPGLSVFRFLEARTYGEPDLRANVERVVELVKRAHRDMPAEIRGPAPFFWVFHVLRDYGHTLRAAGSRMVSSLPKFAEAAERLERAQVPLPLVFGHNDLLPTNVMDDGKRLWLIDWEYGGFNSPMFDLAGLAANGSFERTHELAMLEAYFERPPEEALIRSFDAMRTASALREAMWSMVSEIHLNAPGVDYVAYTADYLQRFEQSYAAFRKTYG